MASKLIDIIVNLSDREFDFTLGLLVGGLVTFLTFRLWK
jgi:hypothetical protein